ncbi:hypothetical protein Nepgr_014202 [Nepenthes gracilis]|uniref:Nucleic acid-binding protein n=1 Tax=Nepenthes gracilis TaxID=150966 RepID=A0AAD3XQ27_NEPGR|nr:hypothetical protein Nepgr_014202 [Nepenthes gracilis]
MMSHFKIHPLINGEIDEDSSVEVMRQHQRQLVEKEDPFLKFIDHAKLVLSPDDDEEEAEDNVRSSNRDGAEQKESNSPGWTWIVSRILKTCISYSSGVTSAILLSELSQALSKQRRCCASRNRPECIKRLKKKHLRPKLSNTLTIDLIYEKNFLSLNSVLEAVIVDAFALPGTNIYMLTLGDFWSSNTIDLYLHRRYYDLVSIYGGILKKGREIFLTGCYFRTASEGFGYARLLPTEYLVILLDEDQDDDAMLIGAQFCSDPFSSISLDAANNGVTYLLYARIEYIGPLEILEKIGGTQRRQITLVDNDGMLLKFILWGEQVVLANLLSVRSMLVVDKPFIASFIESAIETPGIVCLEYGSATQLYLVPFIQQEEQVYVSLSQKQIQGSMIATTLDPSQGPKVSQVTLPCNSQGSVDFSNYPFRTFIVDLHDKMIGVSLYGVVTDIFSEANAEKTIYYMTIEDTTGRICAKLHFSESWSVGRLSLGHTVYICGLTCHMTKQKCLEASWFQNDVGASIINISCLPTILSSSCLHRLSYLADLSRKTSGTNVCRVWLDQSEQWHVNTTIAHVSCGHFVNATASASVECEFCCCNCENEIMRDFHLKITVADESAKVFAWCTGQTAIELLQISPDEFHELPEEEQVIYPSSLENERYMIAVVYCGQQGRLKQAAKEVSWEITGALKL